MIGGKIEISDVADEKGILGKTNARNSAGPWQLQYRRGASGSSSYRSLELTSRISTATAWRNIVQLFITGLWRPCRVRAGQTYWHPSLIPELGC